MEKNKNKWHGRPKKDFWELKEKLNQEAIENKWKFKRGRPKKIKEVATNTIEKTQNNNQFSHKIIYEEASDSNIKTSNAEEISKKFLYCCAIFFLISLVIFSIQKFKNESIDNQIESDNTKTTEELNNGNEVTLELWYNDNSGNFVSIETLETNDTQDIDEPKNNDENIVLIETFYEKINKKDFDSISPLIDKYLKENNSFKMYYSSSWLTNFLNKIYNNEIYVTNINKVPYEKTNVQRYTYDVKYVLNSDQKLHQEQRQIDVVNRNWEHLIWSIMCITTWCSRMPFFQK